jgi:hypothetical protein
MSAIPPKADISERDHHIRFVPKADKVHRSKMARYSITWWAPARERIDQLWGLRDRNNRSDFVRPE